MFWIIQIFVGKTGHSRIFELTVRSDEEREKRALTLFRDRFIVTEGPIPTYRRRYGFYRRCGEECI